MHAFILRASQRYRRRSEASRSVFALAAVLSLALLAGPACPATSTASIEKNRELPLLSDNVAHEIRIEWVTQGSESFEFAARLSEEGGLIQRPIAWILRDSGGQVVAKSNEPVADISAAPGDYEIDATYGTVRLKRTVSLLAGQKLSVIFTLNVGGIRVLPRLAGIGLPTTQSLTSIYAASGTANGQLVDISEMPGEIIRVGSGTYRIESRFAPGNVVAVAEVVVKPGRMSAVEIDHRAGLAHLSLRQPSADAYWTIVDESGGELAPIAGDTADVVLKPGKYTARATISGVDQTVTFSIAAGQRRDILIEN